ncbi:MAG: flippase [Patescibacteria group bacterium]
MSDARALAKNTVVQVAGKIVSIAIGAVIVGIMTRLLGQEGFGAYSTANAFLQVFAIIIDLGLNIAVVQMLGEHAGDQAYENRAVSAVYSLRFWSALILLSLAPIIGLFIPVYSPEVKIAFFAIWASFFFTSLNQIVIGVHQRHLSMHIVAAAELTGRILLFIGVLIATALHWGLIPVVLIVSLGGIANFFVNFIVARRYASFKIGFDWDFWKTTLKKSWPIGISVLFTLIYYKSDTLILSWVRPMAEVGLYGAAYRVLDILAAFPFMYSGVLLPMLAKAWVKKDKQKFARLIQRSFDAFAIITLPMIAGTLLVADKAMALVAGHEFLGSANVLRILILATGCIFIGTIFGHAIVALDRQRDMLWCYIIVAVIALILYWICIPIWGMWAAAWLTVASELSIAIASTVLTLKSGEFTLPLATMWKALLGSFVMFIVAYPFSKNSLWLTIAVAIIAYSAVMLATGAVTKQMVADLLIARKGGGVIEDDV